jgi:hypothetical protein
MRKLLLIDYREKRIAKHQCLEIECNEDIEDRFVVAACHRYIGLNNEMDCVTEIFSDMSVKELNRISLKPECLHLPRRILYVNLEEITRCASMLNGKI